jgi:hypothetical protein
MLLHTTGPSQLPPTGHATQRHRVLSTSVSFRNRSVLQSAAVRHGGLISAVPASLGIFPSLGKRHDSCASRFWYCPNGHEIQEESDAAVRYCPILQRKHVVTPCPASHPPGHCLHCFSFTKESAYLRFGQFSQRRLPRLIEYLPGAQAVCANERSEKHYEVCRSRRKRDKESKEKV